MRDDGGACLSWRTPRVAAAVAAMFLGIAFEPAAAASIREPNQVVQQTCVACHNQHTLQAGLNLQGFDTERPEVHPEIAEKMIRKLRAGQMPPREIPRNPEELEK